MGSIAVIGSLNMDMVLRIPRTPNPGETLCGSDFQLIPGGKGANQAVASSRAGVATKMFGWVGNDTFGKTLCSSLTCSSVDAAAVYTTSTLPTGVATILVEDNGENRIIIIPGANREVSPAYVDKVWEPIARSSLILLQHEIPLETVHHIIQRAHQDKIPVILNAAPYYPIPDKIMGKLSVLVVNEIEASALSGISVFEQSTALKAAVALRRLGVQTVIVTLGALGSVLVNQDQSLYQPGIPVQVVDSTAAGDTFVGSYASTLLDGVDIPARLHYAAVAATMTVTRLGAQSSIPSKQEVHEFMQDKDLPKPVRVR